MEIRFDDFVLDPQRRLLVRDGHSVHLTPKAFDLLALLVDRRPEAVAKKDLEAAIWRGTHVAETSLAGLVAELRTALGDDARAPRYMRTVHGFGYAFCAAARMAGVQGTTVEADELHYRLAWQRREVSLRPGENILGRD